MPDLLLFKRDVYRFWRDRQAKAMDALALAYGPPLLPSVRDLFFWADVGDEDAREKLRPLLRRWMAERLAAQEAAR